VVRTRDPADERQVRITLTQKGRDLQEPVKQAWDMVVCSVGLAPDELEVLKAQITQLRDTLRAGAEKRPSEKAV
jgi:DNA-binding MarR family transcriptional regulator